MIELSLPWPISANRYWATRIVKPKTGKPMALTYVTPEAKAYREAVAWQCKASRIQPIAGRVAVDVEMYPNRPLDWQKRQREHGDAWDDTVRCLDLDNANKVLLDALKGVAFDDDKWVRSLSSRRMEPDTKGRRVVVRITSIAWIQPQLGLNLPAPVEAEPNRELFAEAGDF